MSYEAVGGGAEHSHYDSRKKMWVADSGYHAHGSKYVSDDTEYWDPRKKKWIAKSGGGPGGSVSSQHGGSGGPGRKVGAKPGSRPAPVRATPGATFPPPPAAQQEYSGGGGGGGSEGGGYKAPDYAREENMPPEPKSVVPSDDREGPSEADHEPAPPAAGGSNLPLILGIGGAALVAAYLVFRK